MKQQYSSMRVLSGIYIYPVKSLGGFALEEAVVERRGLRYDRRWMLVDREGRFVSQREVPEMARLGTALHDDSLEIFLKTRPADRVQIPLNPVSSSKLRVQVWSSRCTALTAPEIASTWLSDHLKADVRLVFMPDTTRRSADGRYAPRGQYVSFADGYPYLLIGQASLDDLNGRLQDPVPMSRFRPNLVFSGGTPYEEDEWTDFSVGEIAFRGVKPCARCVVITTDQDTGHQEKEPLRTLSLYRSRGHKVMFGQNVVWMGDRADGAIRIGDPVRP